MTDDNEGTVRHQQHGPWPRFTDLQTWPQLARMFPAVWNSITDMVPDAVSFVADPPGRQQQRNIAPDG